MESFEQGRASPPGEPTGGARRLAEPSRLAGDGSPHPHAEPERLAEDGSPHPHAELGRLAGDGSPHPLAELERLAGDGSPHLQGELSGGANPLGEPRRLASPASPGSPGGFALPVRRKLPHGLPPFPVQGLIVQFVTVNAAERGGMPFLAVAEEILAAARFYHEHGRWFLYLFLVMPDHLHMLATFPSGNGKSTCGAWKGFLRKTAGIRFQSDCFEHRIRNEHEFAEKWHYIRENPVRKGLVDMPDKWPHWIAFDPVNGRQTGGARRLAEPPRLAGDGSTHLPTEPPRLAEDGSPHLSGSAHHLTGEKS